MKHSSTVTRLPNAMKIVGMGLIIIPLLLTLTWGQHLSDEVYMLLRFARGMAANAGLTLDPVGDFPAPTLFGPLFAFIVSIPAFLGIEPATAAMILSAIGWSLTGFTFLALGQRLKRPGGAMIAALLLSFNPAIITTLGSPASWIIALIWLTIRLLMTHRRMVAAIAFLLLVVLLLPWPLGSGWSHLSLYKAAISWSVFLFAACAGADWLAEKLVDQDLVRLTYSQMKTSLLVAIFILLGSWQGLQLWHLFQDRPEMLWQLEDEVASWLRTETDVTATLLANERTGYLAQRQLAALPDLNQFETATVVRALLQADPVDYLVTTNDLPWQQLRELVWFRLAYEPVKQFNSSYLPQSPFIIWAYRSPLTEMGERHSINVRVPDRLQLIGYQIGPEQVRAGESVEMALYLEAPEATFESPTPFQAVVRLISQVDGSTISEWTIDLPQSISPTDWQAKNVIVERFPLTMPDELEAGAYRLNLSLLGPESADLWPMSLDNDFNRLDRVPTGYIIVPWEGELKEIQPVEATFDNDIRLMGFTTTEAEVGGATDVTLTWQTEQSFDEDYVVFVHLVDSNGQLVSSHDGIPGNGRFPTRAWQPGITIPDTHTILLPPDMPNGEYTLKVGLYDPDTGQRLAATAADGTIPGDSSILLTTISKP